MKRLVCAWDHFFFRQFDPYALGLLRIALALVWLVLLAFMSFNWERFYAPEGLSSAVDPAMWKDPWTLFRLTDGVCSVNVWWWIGVAAGACLMIGLLTRAMTVVIWLLLHSMLHREPLLAGACELVLRMALWWCIFMPIGRAISVDEWLRARRRRGEPDTRPLPTMWATRMLQINVAIIFAFSLPMKLFNDPAWLNGDAFFFAIIHDTWSRWPWPGMFYQKWLSMLFTYGGIAIEIAFVCLIWTRWRTRAVLCMWGFHLLIMVMLENVTTFNLATMATYLVFVPPETGRAWVRGATRPITRA